MDREEESEPRNGLRIGHQILDAHIQATNDKHKIVRHNVLTGKFGYEYFEMRHLYNVINLAFSLGR